MSKILTTALLVFTGTLALSFAIGYIAFQLKLWESPVSSDSFFAGNGKNLDDLTLEQKIGQLFLIGFEGVVMTPHLENLIRIIQPGGVLLLSRNIEEEEQLKELISNMQSVSLAETELPLFVSVDQEGGKMSRIGWLPEKTSQAAISNIDQAYQVGLERGKELKELGVNLNLAPVLDITKPADFLHNRSFQKDPQLTAEFGVSLISGQKAAGILTAIKHFPGYGDVSFNPEREKLPILSKLPEISQFRTALQSEPEMIMTSNIVYSEIDKEFPFTLSSKGVQFLKDNLKQGLLVVADDLSSPVLKKEFSLQKTIVLAVKAGIDILIVAGFDDAQDPLLAFNFLLEAVKTGEISEEKINAAVLRIIQLKQNMLE